MWKISSLASDQIACHHWNGGEVQVSWRSEGQDTEEISLGVSGHHHRASRENLQFSPHWLAENRCSEHLYDDYGLLPPQCLDCRQKSRSGQAVLERGQRYSTTLTTAWTTYFKQPTKVTLSISLAKTHLAVATGYERVPSHLLLHEYQFCNHWTYTASKSGCPTWTQHAQKLM